MPLLRPFGLVAIVAGSNGRPLRSFFSGSEHLTGRCCGHAVCPWRQMRDPDSLIPGKKRRSQLYLDIASTFFFSFWSIKLRPLMLLQCKVVYF